MAKKPTTPPKPSRDHKRKSQPKTQPTAETVTAVEAVAEVAPVVVEAPAPVEVAPPAPTVIERPDNWATMTPGQKAAWTLKAKRAGGIAPTSKPDIPTGRPENWDTMTAGQKAGWTRRQRSGNPQPQSTTPGTFTSQSIVGATVALDGLCQNWRARLSETEALEFLSKADDQTNASSAALMTMVVSLGTLLPMQEGRKPTYELGATKGGRTVTAIVSIDDLAEGADHENCLIDMQNVFGQLSPTDLNHVVSNAITVTGWWDVPPTA